MWKLISSKEVFNHPRLSLIEDELILPNGTRTNYLKCKDDGRCAVTIIAKRDDGKILLEKEYAYPTNQKIFQFPGGGVPANEKVEEGANRELMEESGLFANDIFLIGSYLMDNRRSAMKVFVFEAGRLEEKALKRDQEEADLENFWLTEEEITRMIKNNEILNCHALAAWCLYKSKE